MNIVGRYNYLCLKACLGICAGCMYLIPDLACYYALHSCIALSLCSSISWHIYLFSQCEICFAFLCSQDELKCVEWACFGALTGGSYFEGV